MSVESQTNIPNNSPAGSLAGATEMPTEVLSEVTLYDVLKCNYKSHLHIFTREQLVFIGKENLQYYKQCWEKMLAEADAIIRGQDELLELLKGRTIDDFQEIAQQYDDPQYKSRQSGYPGEKTRPDGADVATRPAGSTTLNICGWCKYGIPFDMPRRRVLLAEDGERLAEPCCRLFTDDWNAEYKCGEYDTPCVLTHPRAGQPSPEEIYRGICERRQRYLERQKMVRKRVEYLDTAIAEAESKPLFPCFRNVEHYAEGTPVFFFDRGGSKVKGSEAEYLCLYPYDWSLKGCTCRVSRGTVISHNRYQFVQNTVTAKKAGYLGGVKDTYELAYNDERLVSFEEFTYLAEHPDFAQIWLASIDGRGGEVTEALNFYWQHRFVTSW